jgi:glycosyltransferase involved in cell wall biosynthesis
MRIAYLAHFRGGRETGIWRKIAGQVEEWRQRGEDVGLFVATSVAAQADWAGLPGAVRVTTSTNALELIVARERLASAIRRWRPDLVYLRHTLVYPGLLRLVSRVPTVLEINADDLSEFRHASPRRYRYARLTRSALLQRAAGIVFVTHELSALTSFARFGAPFVVIGNGIRSDEVPIAPPPTDDRPRLLFMGHPNSPWHGLDHLAELAAAFPDWDVDLVGSTADELPHALPPNLAAHGVLEPQAYRPLLDAADVGVGSLALYRNSMNEASTLKVREYLTAGLPVILAHRDTDFPDGAPFILQLPNRADAVVTHHGAIAEFVEAWKGRRVPRSDVAHLDLRAKEARRIRFLEQVVRRRA